MQIIILYRQFEIFENWGSFKLHTFHSGDKIEKNMECKIFLKWLLTGNYAWDISSIYNNGKYGNWHHFTYFCSDVCFKPYLNVISGVLLNGYAEWISRKTIRIINYRD